MSSFHQVGIVAKGKVKDCQTLSEEWGLGCDEVYELRGEDGRKLDFEEADGDEVCTFFCCEEESQPREGNAVKKYSKKLNLDIKVYNLPLEPEEQNLATYVYFARGEKKAFYVVAVKEVFEYLDRDGEEWLESYAYYDGEDWVTPEKALGDDFITIWKDTFEAIFKQAGYDYF